MSAILSDDGRHRYWLGRKWDHGPLATFVMLNPSTADAERDDPTIVRCINFATAWGCAGLAVVNLYALRSTDPKGLWTVDYADRVGEDNDLHIANAASIAALHDSPLVAAWGANAEPRRVGEVMRIPAMARAHVLGVTKGGQPRHPLYLRADTTPTLWRAAA